MRRLRLPLQKEPEGELPPRNAPGAGDHIVTRPKPPKPRTIDREAYAALPDSLTIRECRIRLEQPGFRIHNPVIATTLLNADAYSKDDLALLYRSRWNAEID